MVYEINLAFFLEHGSFTVKGGSPTISKCENFDPIFIEILFFDTQNPFYLIVKGLKNAFLMQFLDCQNEGRPLRNDYPEGLYNGFGD